MQKIKFCLILSFFCCICGCATQQATTTATLPTITPPIIDFTPSVNSPTSTPEPIISLSPTITLEVTVEPSAEPIITSALTNTPTVTETPVPTATSTPVPTPTNTTTPKPVITNTPTPVPNEVEVPNLVGLKIKDACVILDKLNFNYGIESVYSDEVDVDVVISQDLEPGIIVEINTIIWLEYSIGPEPTPTATPSPTATPTPSVTPTPRPTATPKPSPTPYPMPDCDIVSYEESRNGNTTTIYEDGTIVETYSETENTCILYPDNKELFITKDGLVYWNQLDDNGKKLYTEYIHEFQLNEKFLMENGIYEDFDKYKIYFVMHYHDKEFEKEFRYIGNSDGSKNKWSEYMIDWNTPIGASHDHIRLYDIDGNVIKITFDNLPLYDY